MSRHFALCGRLGFLLTLAAFILAISSAPRAANADSPSSPFAGTFSNDKLVVELSESGDGYIGTITRGQQRFPVTARVTGQGLTGTFESSGNRFVFEATLADGRLVLVTGAATYTLAKAERNPLSDNGASPVNPLNEPAPAIPPADNAKGDSAKSFGAFSVLGETQSGKTLFIKLSGALTLESTITQTADELGKVFDGKPAVNGAFADSQTKSRGGALLTAKLKGRDIRGWIFCGVGEIGANGGGTANVIVAPADVSETEVATLFAFMPAPVKMQKHVFPDGSGSVDLPPGWTTQQQSASFGVAINGPAGQTVMIGNTILVNTPDGLMASTPQKTYQVAMGTYRMQMQAYEQNVAARRKYPNILALQEPKKPVPPDAARDMPMLIFCRYCSGPDEVLKYLYPVLETRAKTAGGRYTTLDKIIAVVPADSNPLIANAKAGVAYLAVSDHEGGKITHFRAINRIETYPILAGKDTWVVVFNAMRAADTSFDRDLTVMNDIMASFKMNMDVVNKQIADAGAAVRKMGDDAERQLLKRSHDFNKQQDENFRRFESQELAREKARHDSSSDFIEYITGVRHVYDTKTGQMLNVDLFNSNAIVNGMNDAAMDPRQFVQIPLRYER